MSRVINVSPSVLADVMACDTRAWTRHVMGYTSKHDALKAVAGQAMHAGIAAMLQSHGSPQDALAAFHAVYDSAFAARSIDEWTDAAYTPENLARILGRWIETHPPSTLPWSSVLEVETAFVSRTWSFNGTLVQLVCRPDAVVEVQDRVRWVDTKSTGWNIGDAAWRRTLKLSLQAALYTDAITQRFGARASMGGWFNAMEVRSLPKDPARVCATHKVVYEECGHEHAKTEFIECIMSEARIDAALQDAYRAAEHYVTMLQRVGDDDVAALGMQGTAKEGCRFCAAAEWCEAGRYPAALASFLQYQPWPVEVGTR